MQLLCSLFDGKTLHVSSVTCSSLGFQERHLAANTVPELLMMSKWR